MSQAATPSAQHRRADILERLSQAGSVRVVDLAESFGVSTVTIRSDLMALERMGRLRRVRGGAVALSKAVTASLQDQRMNVHVDEKAAIARAAARLVHPGESVLLDSGTTARHLALALADTPGITVITNDLTICDLVDRSLPEADVIMLGGLVNKGHRYTSGPLTMSALRTIHPTHSFVCPTGFIPGQGLMTNNQEMAQLKAAFLECSVHTCVIMDSSKVGKSGLLRFGGLSDAETVIVDADPDGTVAAELEGSSSRLVTAQKSVAFLDE